MSNFFDVALNPETNKLQRAVWIDDYFRPHRYGVMFIDNLGDVCEAMDRAYKNGEKVYEEKEIKLERNEK